MGPIRIRAASGMWLVLLDQLGCDGLSLPFCGIVIRPQCMADGELIRHEVTHAVQIERMGPLRFAVRYLFELWRDGYTRMPLEVEARQRANGTLPFLVPSRPLEFVA